MSIAIYTDGSCIGNPGPGGWAYLIEAEGKAIRGQGGEPDTTNNRMELTALIEGLKKAETLYPSEINFDVYSDSSWVLNTLKLNWKRKKNLDLWALLEPHLKGKKFTWNWVRGHNGHPQNEDCDTRAQKEAGLQAFKAGRPTFL
ncbi:ribonuclease HI [Candidatus Peregrinibacteria bacterium]|nr:MAG: ribonuclease HI [Candidatus Peregrinibacteria bacterium]